MSKMKERKEVILACPWLLLMVVSGFNANQRPNMQGNEQEHPLKSQTTVELAVEQW